MILKENNFFRKLFIVTEYAALNRYSTLYAKNTLLYTQSSYLVGL